MKCLVDIRRHPSSRRNPQFNQPVLAETLRQRGLRYEWMGEALGGRRKPLLGSAHLALRDDPLRGFAGYMEDPGFCSAVAHVLRAADHEPTAIMCAERLPEYCHRSLISDSLVARGVVVHHIIDGASTTTHELDPRARRVGDGLVYDLSAQLELPI